VSYEYSISELLKLEVFGRNLLNETYRETNDRKSALGAERTLGIAMNLLF
jgi:outer membrane receptor for ferric coprogen and ferric-rhodotorulic acid